MKICDYDYIAIISSIKFTIKIDYDYSIFVIDYNQLQLWNYDFSEVCAVP